MKIFFAFLMISSFLGCESNTTCGRIYYNGSRSIGVDSNNIVFFINGKVLLDTIIKAYDVDTYILIKEFQVLKDKENIVRLKVNNKDSTLSITNRNRDFGLFFYYDNKTKLRNKTLDELSSSLNRERNREHVRDSLHKVFGSELDSLHVVFDYTE